MKREDIRSIADEIAKKHVSDEEMRRSLVEDIELAMQRSWIAAQKAQAEISHRNHMALVRSQSRVRRPSGNGR